MNTVKVALAIAFVSASVCLVASERAARADVPPPNMTCGNKKPGDACVDDDKKSGTCTASKCSRRGSVAGPNGTMERTMIEYDCTLCVAGSAAPAPGPAPAPSTSSSASAPAEKKGCNASGTGASDASLFVLGALGLIAWRRRR